MPNNQEQQSPFDGPFSNKANDELSTENVTDLEDVRAPDGALIGQTGYNDEPTRTGFVARDAHYAKWGDIPGQITGWVKAWRSRGAAEDALWQHVRKTQEREQ